MAQKPLNVITEKQFHHLSFPPDGKPVIVFFSDPRLKGCREMKRVVGELFAECGDTFAGYSVNVRRNSFLRYFCCVRNLPSIVHVESHGTRTVIAKGVHSKNALRKNILTAIGSTP